MSDAVLACWLGKNESDTHECVASQYRFGRNTSAATPTAIHGPRVLSRPRPGDSTSPTSRPSSSAITVYLVSSPIPATSPNTHQRRGSGRPRISRAT